MKKPIRSARNLSIPVFFRWAFLLPTSILGLIGVDTESFGFEPNQGDQICLVGNALGERLQHHNQWESLIHQRYADKQLAIRNLCFPGDEPYERIRSQNFGHPDQHLSHSKASVVVYFFGYNESFAGTDGVKKFRKDMARLVTETQQNDYGNGSPRVVLVSPIGFEATDNPNLPDGKERNQRLSLYRDALKEVAAETGVSFANVFDPTLELFESTEEQLTLNGCHLNAKGYAALAPILAEAIFGPGGPSEVDDQVLELIDDKNFHWWHRYRAVNGFSIYGGRGKAGKDGSGTYNNTDVMERERAILDQMTANRDQAIWAVASGKEAPDSIDDSNTLPFINPTTNVGGPNDPNAKRGKLGSLEYLNAAEQQKLFDLHEGFEMQLVASEEQFPELANPVALNFDNKGRLWIATMPSYPHWKPKDELDDQILILEDHDKDGTTDEVKVFAGGLHQPTGFEIAADGVYIAEQPDILFAKDTDGDDKADVVTRKLFGFDTADSHHGISAFEWGPGGNLYFQEGTFKFSQVETPYGLVRLGEAGIWNYHPKNERLAAFSNFAFANPWGHVFDRWGQDFIGDASPGYGYWAAPITGRLDYPKKHPGGSQHRRVAALGGGDPKYQFPRFYPKRIRPLSGCAMVSSRHFPEEMQGNYLVTNVIGDRGVLNHEVREDGTGFVGKEVEPLLMCRDGNFRPVDIQVAPDGSLYIVDWHNALIGHLQHNLRDPSRDHSHGRIWRIKHKTRPLVEEAKIDGAPVAELLDLLKLPEDRTRYRARRELAARDSNEVGEALATWVSQLNASDTQFQHHMLEALWMYQTHHLVNESHLDRLLQSPDHRARAAAMRVLSFWIGDVSDPLGRIEAGLNDEHPRVRLEAVRALSFTEGDEAVRLAVSVMNHPMDDYLRYTLDETMRRLEQAASEPLQLFLDDNQEIVEYQVKRLDDSQLLASKRSSDDPSSIPVYREILTRLSITPAQRNEAVGALVSLQSSSPAKVLLESIGRLDRANADQRVAARKLASALLSSGKAKLNSQLPQLREFSQGSKDLVRSVAMAALVVSGSTDLAIAEGSTNEEAMADLMVAVPMIPTSDQRAELRDVTIAAIQEKRAASTRRSAITALASIPADQADSFQTIAPLASDSKYRDAAIAALNKIPTPFRDQVTSEKLLGRLLAYAQRTPAAKRTSSQFTDAMQLADTLMASVSPEMAKEGRAKLRDIAVRLVRIGSVEEEMRYDVEYFAVEAGRPVQILLENHDLMPHNLVITQPGALKEVAQLGLQAGPSGGWKGLPYVPESDKVIQATGMVDARGETRLTFKAPKQPGEYPYVCTFPQHWYRMYGVMVVVEDLDAWQRNPVKPANPIGSNRSFVANWKVDDFAAEMSTGLQGRKPEIGKRVFVEASCAGCHVAEGEGGVIGPDLTELYTRWKGDDVGVLREILEPSHRIDEKYAMQQVLTIDGQTYTGVLVGKTPDTISLLASAEAKEPTVIAEDDIEIMKSSSISIMPKALMDQYTKDEVFELLAYLKSLPKSE